MINTFLAEKQSTFGSMEKDCQSATKSVEVRRFSKDRNRYALFAFRNLLHLEEKNQTIKSNSLGTPKIHRIEIPKLQKSSSDPSLPRGDM